VVDTHPELDDVKVFTYADVVRFAIHYLGYYAKLTANSS